MFVHDMMAFDVGRFTIHHSPLTTELPRNSHSTGTQLALNWQGTGGELAGNWQGTGTQLAGNWLDNAWIMALRLLIALRQIIANEPKHSFFILGEQNSLICLIQLTNQMQVVFAF